MKNRREGSSYIGDSAIKYKSHVRRKITMHLPRVSVFGESIQLAMHTDNIQIMARHLTTLTSDERRALYIEGRSFPDVETQRRLERDPIYSFYLNGRHVRQIDDLVYLLPSGSGFSDRQVQKLVNEPYSPRTLQKRTGHNVVFYNAEDLYLAFLQGPIYPVRPFFGGANELRLGSDTLRRHRLQQIAKEISKQIGEDNDAKPVTQFPMSALAAFAVHKLTENRRLLLDRYRRRQLK